ncbi:MAG: hypothetical protein DMF86_19410 [Acidobacteria bacterium]|nr:MAG: hypothetical protein DMF86_19410 [Acidobacteriota bacterium]
MEDRVHPSSFDEVRSHAGYCDLTGLPLPKALDKLIECAPSYTWNNEIPVSHVLPRSFVDKASVALSRRVDHFDLYATDLQDRTLWQRYSASLTQPTGYRPIIYDPRVSVLSLRNL